MNNALLLQSCIDPSVYVAAASRGKHRMQAWAQRHAMDYVLDFVPARDPWAGITGWRRVQLIQAALGEYEFIVYLDVDTLVIDLSVDPRLAFEGPGVGMVKHDHPMYGRHWNAGVMYIRRDDAVMNLMYSWLHLHNSKQDQPPTYEQAALNWLSSDRRSLFKQVEDKWNATLNVNMVDHPVIVAAHGQGLQGERDVLLNNWLVEYELGKERV